LASLYTEIIDMCIPYRVSHYLYGKVSMWASKNMACRYTKFDKHFKKIPSSVTVYCITVWPKGLLTPYQAL